MKRREFTAGQGSWEPRASAGSASPGLVVALLVLLNETLQADITSDFVSEVIALEQEQKSGNTAIAIPEGMDA
jgi:hypothetical protein